MLGVLIDIISAVPAQPGGGAFRVPPDFRTLHKPFSRLSFLDVPTLPVSPTPCLSFALDEALRI